MALPLHESIIVERDSVLINGKELDREGIIAFHEAVIALKENYARKIINEQIRYLAINVGINKSQTLDQLYFAKAGLWLLDEEEKILDKLV